MNKNLKVSRVSSVDSLNNSHSIASIEDFLKHQNNQDILRFITCGSVDDGKSTLIGRILWETKSIYEDQVVALHSESIKYGTQGKGIDFALLVDGLSAERDQGITIDVAYRYFSCLSRKFIVADTPGHEQYTRNMVTGASTADLAILLIDATHGLQTQTKRHAYICSLLGVKHALLAVNKMDLIDYDSEIYSEIKNQAKLFMASMNFESIDVMPISALNGDNISKISKNMPWYHGPSLMEFLENLNIVNSTNERMAFPVQWVNRSHSDFRGYSGTVAQGEIKVGDEVRVASSGLLGKVVKILTMDRSISKASSGEAITLCLDTEIDISRGDVLSNSSSPIETTDQFLATLVWMAAENGMTGRSYDLKIASQWTVATITNIKYQINVNTLAQEPTNQLKQNDIVSCNISTRNPIAFDSYEKSRSLGSFILVDKYTNMTVAAGMIQHSLRRSTNVHAQLLTISRKDREVLNGYSSKVIWFTGLSGSGKSTLANALEIELHSRGYRTFILDGDNIRKGLNKDLGFTDADRVENIRRISEVAKLMMDAGIIVLTAFISPFQREREIAKELVGHENFFEVYVDAPIEICRTRDVKGLYRLADKGDIPNMTGVNSPYEPPKYPDYVAKTDRYSIDQIVKDLVSNII